MRKECTALVLAGVLLLAAVPCAWPVCAQDAAPGTAVDIVFTHDTHSHLNTFTTMVDGLETELGGFARMNTLIEAQRAQNPDTLVIDGGDFSMGTLIQTVFETQAAEIRMLGYMGCDVTTLGNHEFDYRSKGLANMLNSAAESGDDLPAMVVCNVDWESMEAAGLSEGQQQIRDAFDEYGVSDYVVLEKGDTDIAVVGVFGKDALACAPTRCAAAMFALRKTAFFCSSLIIASSSSEALTELTPKDTISTPRRFAHFSESTSLSASAISAVCPGSAE